MKIPKSLKEVSERGTTFWNVINEILRMSPLLVVIGASYLYLWEAPQLVSSMISLSIVFMLLAAIHVARQFLQPYIKLGALIAKASETSLGAAIVFAVSMAFIMLVLFLAVVKAETYDQKMLNRATPYIPVLKQSFVKYWADAPLKYCECGKIEQESSWSRFAELHTSREWGVSFSQITIAYNKDGTVRFDKFKEAKRRYKELQGWEWKDRFNVKMNFTFIVLEDKRNFLIMKAYFSNDINRWAASMIAYNAGSDTVWNRRALCKTTEGCNYKVWFGGLDTVKTKGEDKLLYGRPLWQARNEYPYKIIFKRSPKYIGRI